LSPETLILRGIFLLFWSETSLTFNFSTTFYSITGLKKMGFETQRNSERDTREALEPIDIKKQKKKKKRSEQPMPFAPLPKIAFC
jgi:hypothetical protein